MERGDVKRELDDMNARMVAAESAVTVLRMEVDGIRTDIEDLGMDTPPSPQYCPPPFPDGSASHGRPEMDTAFKVTVVPEPEPGSGIKGPYWRMYVPGGCVQLDGVPVKVKGPDGKDVEGDEVAISQDGPGDALRCVVYTDKVGTPVARIDAVVSNGYGGPALSDGDVLLADVPLYLFSDYRGYGEMKPNAQVHLGVIALTSHGPCHVDSISNATWNGSLPDDVEYTGMDMTVDYTKTGSGCVDGTNSFTIPILRTKGSDFSMDVTDEDVAGTTDHPNGGVKVTLSPSAGLGTNFTVWNGKDGNDGSDAVVDAYSERISGSPGRTRVTLTPNNGGNQTQFDVLDGADASVDVDSVDVSPSLDHPNGGVKVTLTPNVGVGSMFNVWNGKDGASVSSVDVDGEPYTDGGYTITKLRITFDDGRSSTVDISARTGGLSGTISFISNVRYDYDSHSIQKQTSTMDLATGVVNVGQWTTVDGGVAASHNSDIKD